MSDEVQAVNPAESAPAEQTVTNQPADGQQAHESTQDANTSTQPVAAVPQNDAIDETGVPFKNRAFEWKRKYEETVERLPSMIEEAIKNTLPQGQAQQREYSIAELEQFAIDNPAQRPWVEQQKSEVIRKQLTREVEERQSQREKQQQDAIRRQQSFGYVVQNYPDAFIKDQAGQVIGWNNQSPLFRQVDVLMQDKRFKDDPQGLEAAFDIAYARYARGQQPNQQKKEQQLKAEVKTLQRQTLVESGARNNVQAVPEHRAAIEQAKKSGSLRDVQAALSALTKAKRQASENK